MRSTKLRSTKQGQAALLILLSLYAVVVLNAQTRTNGSYLGVRIRDIDADHAKELNMSGEISGVLIVAVLEGAAAYQAGIRPGDVLLSYNGEKLLGTRQLIRLVDETPPGRHVSVVCLRGAEQKEMTVITGDKPVVAATALDLVPGLQVMDIPSTIMLWKNVILGIESESISEQLARAFGVKQGILVWSVLNGSPAQHAGLRAGDVLIDLCGHSIHSPREVGSTLQQLQPSLKPLSMGIIRDHKQLSLSVSLDASEH